MSGRDFVEFNPASYYSWYDLPKEERGNYGRFKNGFVTKEALDIYNQYAEDPIVKLGGLFSDKTTTILDNLREREGADLDNDVYTEMQRRRAVAALGCEFLCESDEMVGEVVDAVLVHGCFARLSETPNAEIQNAIKVVSDLPGDNTETIESLELQILAKGISREDVMHHILTSSLLPEYTENGYLVIRTPTTIRENTDGTLAIGLRIVLKPLSDNGDFEIVGLNFLKYRRAPSDSYRTFQSVNSRGGVAQVDLDS